MAPCYPWIIWRQALPTDAGAFGVDLTDWMADGFPVMDIDWENRRAVLGVGELSRFSLGPSASSAAGGGLWRADLGRRWHTELQARTAREHPGATFEVPTEGDYPHRYWTLRLRGRLDQVIEVDGARTLREVKSIVEPLPRPESELRELYPDYFAQAAAYRALALMDSQAASLRVELVFVEAGSGITQTVGVGTGDAEIFHRRLDRLVDFLENRLQARSRRAALSWNPPFEEFRKGQDTAPAQLDDAFRSRADHQSRIVFFEAPTGFGKTGLLLEFALKRLREGEIERVIYLTGKSTGQWQVRTQLEGMIDPGTPVGIWQMRPKTEHCVNEVFHCAKAACRFLEGLDSRWEASGLARIASEPGSFNDLDAVRFAGRDARLCPYEITRSALACRDIWIGDYNYVFSPSSRPVFYEQPGFDPASTLLLIDEAHNLPSRVAEALSAAFSVSEAATVTTGLQEQRAPQRLLWHWREWTLFLENLDRSDRLEPEDAEQARDLAERMAGEVRNHYVDLLRLGPERSELYWKAVNFAAALDADWQTLLWSPVKGELRVTCLDASTFIGEILRTYAGVVFASATLRPWDTFAAACGLPESSDDDVPPAYPADLSISKEPTDPRRRLGRIPGGRRKLFKHLTTAGDLLRIEEEADKERPRIVRTETPWRDGSYRIAVDLRADTTYRKRDSTAALTAASIASLARVASGCAAVFFPSYAYGHKILEVLERHAFRFRAAMQPRVREPDELVRFIENGLNEADVLFLVLGGGFAEGVDLLGGHITHAMVVGPALPEVNALQKAKQETFAHLGRAAAFRRTYVIPGMTKVNQALGRLVRAPGQSATILLHCRRFADPEYADLLAPEYRNGTFIRTEQEFDQWLACQK